MDFHLWDLNQVWQLQWKIFTAVYTYWGGAFGRKRAFNPTSLSTASLHIIYYTHKRKKKKMSRFRLYNDSRIQYSSFKPWITDKWGTGLCGRIPAISTVVREEAPGPLCSHQFKWVSRNCNKQVMCNTAFSMASKETLALLISLFSLETSTGWNFT